MNRARILLVDDDPALLTSLCAALSLREPDVEVDRAESAASALKFAQDEEYDAVVTDIKLPGMDGLSLLAELREKIPKVPILLITGHGQHDLAVQALRGGAFDFIQKPIDRDYFIASLNRAVQVRQLSRKVDLQQRDLERHAANLERTVAERTRQLQEANQTKDRFLAMLAHELRNPLATIRSASELLSLCDANDPELLDVQTSIIEQVRHMARMLDDLLDISRITRNRIALKKECLDFRLVVQSGVDSLRSAADEFDHQVDLTLPPQPVLVDGDRTRLEQIVVNILNNAVKYTDPGGEIRVKLEADGGMAALQVEDSGIGIEPEMLASVFDMFTQADGSLHRSQGGLGIGLSLVKNLAELHGGSVEADSDGIDRGSRFAVRIPLAEERSQPRPRNDWQPAERLDCSHRILIVEDNRGIANMMEKLLTRYGHCVVGVAASGDDAIDAVQQFHPEVVLIDIGLPGMDGYQLATKLRTIQTAEAPLLIAVTGYGQEEDRRRSAEAGFDLHLVKPVSIDSLQQAIAGYAGVAQAQ